MSKTNPTVLALYPNPIGIGYALFHSPKELVDYGIGNLRPISIKRALKKIQRYIDYYKPDVVITRELHPGRKSKSKRVQNIINIICSEAKLQSLQVHSYSRKEIQDTLGQFEAVSKFQISKKLIEWFPALERYEYPKRKRWMSEHYNVGIFDAISLGMVHFYRH